MKPEHLFCLFFYLGLLETRPAMEHLTLLMNRAKKGFGFTVTGGNPVRVGRVEEGGLIFLV